MGTAKETGVGFKRLLVGVCHAFIIVNTDGAPNKVTGGTG